VKPEIALVFAAGLGTRMRPLTLTTPKPLIPVAGKALIDHTLDRLQAFGVETAIVNVHYLPDQILAHLAARPSPRIVIQDERALLLDQGGAIKRARPLLGAAPFLVANTDAFWQEGARSNLARLAEAFDAETMDAALLVAQMSHAIGAEGDGDFELAPSGRLTRRRAGTQAPYVYTGIGILKPQLFDGVAEDVFKLAPFFWAAAEQGRLYGVQLEGLWLHVGRPETIPIANRHSAPE